MKRRHFLTTTGIAALAPLPAAVRAGRPDQQQVLELRRYTMPIGTNKDRLHAFMRDVAVPAFNRIGVRPVGAFTVVYGQTDPTLYVLLPYSSLTDFAESRLRLFQEEAYASAVDTAMDEGHYVRFDSKLMRAFAGMPTVEAPDTSQPRIFELRTYESHNAERARRKIEMFNKGEIDIFRKTNLTPVFFGETLAGDRMPNLTYLITHEDMAARDAHWEDFINHPDWKAMSSDSYYADTVSNISNVVLRPTAYSQV